MESIVQQFPLATPCPPTKPGKVIWTSEEDAILKRMVELKGTTSWTAIAQSLPERSGKQCRERWHNHLEEGIKKGDWSKKEDKIILAMQKIIGNQWAKITKLLPGRTDNSVKNRYHVASRTQPRGSGQDEAIPEDVLLAARYVNDPDIQNAIANYYQKMQTQMETPHPVPCDVDVATTPESDFTSATAVVADPHQWEQAHVQSEEIVCATVPNSFPAPMYGGETVAPVAYPMMQPAEATQSFAEAVEWHQDEGSDTDSLLMDLELASFDDDFAYLDDSADEADVKPAEKSSARCLDIDPCCFSNFDWGFLANNKATAERLNAPMPPYPQQVPMHMGHLPQGIPRTPDANAMYSQEQQQYMAYAALQQQMPRAYENAPHSMRHYPAQTSQTSTQSSEHHWWSFRR